MWRRTGGSLSGWIVFGGSLVFYASSLAPGIELWDTGEMQTDANALFIAHPTGFPLFVLGGWLFSHALPIGDPAWRISLFSAIAVSVAAAMLALFVYDLTRDAIVSTAAGLVFAPVPTVWLWAERADPHDVTLALTAIALVLAARAGSAREMRPLRFAGVAWGAAAATHPVALFALPALALLAWPALARVRVRALGTLVVGSVAPLALYAYVPLRSIAIEHAALDPSVVLGLSGSALVDDGAPATAAGLARYLFATRFAPGDALAGIARPSGLANALVFAHGLAYDQYGMLALALALVGFGALAYRSRRIAAALGLLGVGGIAFASNYTIEAAPGRYALAAFWALSTLAAYGAWWFAHAIVQRPRVVPLCAAALLFASLVPVFGRGVAMVRYRADKGDARAEASQIVAATRDGSVVVSTWTYATPLAYAKYVSGTFGSRFIVSGWPTDFANFYATWHERYGHVYFIIDGSARGIAFGKPLYREPSGRYVLSEYVP